VACGEGGGVLWAAKDAAPAAEAPSSGAPADPGLWGTTKRGEVYRPLLTKLEAVTGMPLRLYLCVVANREAGWSRTARNKTKGEVKASQDGIDNGIKRGNPAPKFATSLREAGSGGLFGALSPFVAWTGMDEDFMPYLNEDWPIEEHPDALFAGLDALESSDSDDDSDDDSDED
jgi:hypothetical protein